MASNKSLSTLEVAEILHVSKSTIYELSPYAFSFLKNGHEEATSRTFARMVAFSYLPESDCCSPVRSNLLNCVICSQVFYPAGVALVQFFLPDSLLAVLPLPNPALHSFFSFWIDYSLRTSGKRSADRHPQALGEGVEYFFSIASCFRCNYIIESNRNQILYG